MAEKLPRFIPAFAGDTRLIRCFLHVLNLVVKSILKRFESSGPSTDSDLADLLQDIDSAEESAEDVEDDDDDNDIVADRLSDEWADVVDEMSFDEQEELEEQVKPARRVILKVCTTVDCIM